MTSDIVRRPFRAISKKHPVISYFGNISLGRNKSLNDIGQALYEIDNSYKLYIYSNETSGHLIGAFKDNPGVCFKGAVPYSQVVEETNKSDILVIVEGFAPGDITAVKYSLSTKAADSLASGASIFTYGPLESGVIDYMKSTGASVVCTDVMNLKTALTSLINDVKLQKEM